MTVVPNPLVRNGHLVESLERSLRSGKHGLSVVPGLLKQVLAEGSWQEFTTQRDELVLHQRFADFVTTPPLKGLGASVDLIRRVIGDDPEALDLLDKALSNPAGVHLERSGTDVISIRDNAGGHGTSRAYALRKLRKDAPELHTEVLAGRLTAHKAMVQAGFRPPTFTVRADSPESVAKTLRRQLDPAVLSEVVRLINWEG